MTSSGYTPVPLTDWPASSFFLAVSAALVAYAAWQTRTGNWQWLTIITLTPVMLLTGWWTYREVTLERTLASAIREVSGDPHLNVNCRGWTASAFLDDGYDGRVYYHGNEHRSTDLNWEVCDAIRGFINDPQVTDPARLRHVTGVHILSHELQHLKGERGEAAAECAAVTDGPALAEALGATKEQAAEMPRIHAEHIRPRLPRGYRSACR